MSYQAQRKDLTIISQNARGLKSNDKFQELFGLIKEKELFAVCVQETWRKGNAILEQHGCLLLTNGIDEGVPTCRRGKEGVAIALSQNAVKAWKDAGSVLHNDLGSRIIAIRLSVKDSRNKVVGLFLVSAYAPVGAASQFEWDNFLNKLEQCIRRKPARDILLIGCDTNSSLGIQRREGDEKSSVGRYGLPHKNNAGTRFQTFLEVNRLIAATTYFRKKNYATWSHPRSKLPHQIDHIITEKRDFFRLLHSDHKAVRCCLRLTEYFRKRTTPRKKISRLDSNALSDCATSAAFNSSITDYYNKKGVNYRYHDLANDMYTSATKFLPLKPRAQPEWFAANEKSLIDLIEKRNSALSSKIKRNTRAATIRLRKTRKELKLAVAEAKSNWILRISNKLNESAASRKGSKLCWDSIKTLKKGLQKPVVSAERKMRKEDGTRAQSPEENADVFRSHFEKLYARDQDFDSSVTDLLEGKPIFQNADMSPSKEEIKAAIKRLKNNSPGESGLTAQMFKSLSNNETTFEIMYKIVLEFWNNEIPPTEWDTGLLKIIPKKGDLNKPENYRGIMLLEVAYKIVAIVIHQRLQPIVENLEHETQCGFRRERGCMDAVFSVKLAMMKRREHQQETWILFLDLVKAFDRVPRELLWEVLLKSGVPPKLVRIIKSLHRNFDVKFEYNGITHTLKCSIGVKQGDILGPVLFIIFIAAIMETWRKRFNRPLCLFRSKNDFVLTGRRHNMKGIDFPMDDSEYADDTAVLFDTRNSLAEYTPLLLEHFSKFGMEVHVGDRRKPDKPSKTEILFVAAPGRSYVVPETFDDKNLNPLELGDDKYLPIVDRFCYLGTILTRNCKDAEDVSNRIKCAGNAFGSLRKILFSNPNISYPAKRSAYLSLVLPIALYGSECWCLKENLLQQLRLFHHTCIRAMCRVNLAHTFKHRITTVELMERLNLKSIDSYVTKRQLTWAGHVARMEFDRLPRKLLSSWVTNKRLIGCPEFTYGRGLFKALNKATIPTDSWHELAQDRNAWYTSLAGI